MYIYIYFFFKFTPQTNTFKKAFCIQIGKCWGTRQAALKEVPQTAAAEKMNKENKTPMQ